MPPSDPMRGSNTLSHQRVRVDAHTISKPVSEARARGCTCMHALGCSRFRVKWQLIFDLIIRARRGTAGAWTIRVGGVARSYGKG